MKKQSLVLILLVVALIFAFASCDGIANKKVDKLEIISGAPVEVEVGQTPDFSEIKVKATYNDGEVKEIGYADLTISSIDTSKAGKVEYTIGYGGASAKSTITVKATSDGPDLSGVTLESITYLSGISTGFYVGADFHITDLKVTAHYSDKTTKVITSDKLTVVQNIDCDVVGTQTLIVEYEGKRCEISIKVEDIVAVRFSLKLNGFVSEILVGRHFDTSMITGVLHYNNSSTKDIANSEISFSTVDTATAGAKTLVGTYQGMEGECNVTVLGIKEFEVTGFKTAIKYDEELDLSAIVGAVIASNNVRYELAASEITVDRSGFDTTLDGISEKITKIAFSYYGKTCEYNIRVTADRKDAELVSLEYVSGVKNTIFVGQEYNDTALVAKAGRTFGYDSNVTKADLTVSGTVNSTVAGTYPVTYSLTEDGKTARFTVEVTVVEPTPTSIKLNKNDLGWVIKGETLDTSAVTATLYYDYAAKTTALNNSELTFAVADTSSAGEFELTVSYLDFTATATYTVVTATEITDVFGIDGTVSLGSAAYLPDEVVVTVLLSNGETVDRTVSEGVIIDESAYDSTEVGTTALTVKFGDAEKAINVNVIEVLEELVLQSIQIQQNTLTSSIYAGEAYSYEGIKVVAYYNYDITKIYGIANGLTVTTEGSTETAGIYKLTASYTHNGVTKTADFEVTVKAVVATELEITGSYPDSILIGDSFNTAGITAKLHFNNGKVETLENSALTFVIDVTTAGNKTLTVTHSDTDLSATATVTVVGIKSVVFNGIANRYRVNTALTAQNVTNLTIVGTDNETYVRSLDAALATFPTLTLDITKQSETKEYTFTYRGVEYKQNIEVYAEFADATLIGIEYNGATRILIGGSVTDSLSVKANYTYGFTKNYRAADGVSFEGEITTGAKGNYTITVKYADKSVTVNVSVEYPKVTGIVVNSAPIGVKGEAFDYDSINVTIYLENNDVKTGTLADLADYGINYGQIDVTVAGAKNLTLTANGKNYTHTVTVYEIEKVIIDTEDFDNIVQLGSSFSTDGLGKIMVYLKGVQKPIIREVSEFDHNVDTATRGVYELTATYLGVTSEPVKIFVADQNFVITGVEDPSPIATWKQGVYSGKFLDSGYKYTVGDDNPFKYELKFQLFDIINNKPDTRGISYVGKSTVTLNGAVVGGEYVAIDEENHTFDFTPDAIGKTFVITTSHKDYPEYSKSLEVTVVDAYNVDEAIELNLLTNGDELIGNSGKYQREVLYSFLKNNRVAGIDQMTYEQYLAFVNGLQGIVIHDKLVIGLSDLPEEYFFITATGEKYLWDHQTIFSHIFTEPKLDKGMTPSVFNLYGNYFTIISNNVPIVSEQGMVDKNNIATNNDDPLSSSQFIMFDVSQEIFNLAQANNKFYAENYQVNIYALGLHDNDPSVAVQPELAQKRAKLGIIGLKTRRGTYNLKAVNIEAYFTSIIVDYDDVTANFDYCTLYNAWNNHIYVWQMNIIDSVGDKYDGSIHDGYTPNVVNVTNSFVAKCGGPVFITQTRYPEVEFNTLTGQNSIINIDSESEVFSYVKGDEAWFQAYQATPIMNNIVGFNNLFATENASFVTSIDGNSGFINFIMLKMDADFNPVTFAGTTTDIDGSINIGGETKLDMNDWSYPGVMDFKYGHGGGVDAILMQAQQMGMPQMPPIFVSDNGGISYTDTTKLYVEDLSKLGITNTKENALSGDYLAMYLYNLGVLLGYNEQPMAKEPSPATTSIVKITTSHGYN